jgi:hypothetical protein
MGTEDFSQVKGETVHWNSFLCPPYCNRLVQSTTAVLVGWRQRGSHCSVKSIAPAGDFSVKILIFSQLLFPSGSCFLPDTVCPTLASRHRRTYVFSSSELDCVLSQRHHHTLHDAFDTLCVYYFYPGCPSFHDRASYERDLHRTTIYKYNVSRAAAADLVGCSGG